MQSMATEWAGTSSSKQIELDAFKCPTIRPQYSTILHMRLVKSTRNWYISRIQCIPRDEENWRSWTWPMKNRISQALGSNGRNGYKEELWNSDNQEHWRITTSWNERKSGIQNVPEGIIFRYGHLASSLTMNTGINFQLLLVAGTHRCCSSVE
jgi:hypothetical protein